MSEETTNEVPTTIGVDPDEMEKRPVVPGGRYGADGESATLEGLELRRNQFKEDRLEANLRVLIRTPEQGTITVFHAEPVDAKTNSRFPKWMEQFGFPRGQLATTPIDEIASALGVPGRPVVVEVALREGGAFKDPKTGSERTYGPKNTIVDIMPAA